MKALIWKEIRENIHWALLLTLSLGGAMMYVLKDAPGNGYELWQTLCSPTFLTVTTFGFSLAGLVLGFLQILPEMRKDRWAFWIHRPVSTNQLFFGKIIAGTLLYALTTLIPLSGAIVWVAILKNSSIPFAPGMAIPGLVDALSGLSFYFVALLVSLIPGKWYSTRFLPLLGAFVVLGVLSDATGKYSAWVPLFYIMGVLTFLFVSTWAAFLKTGSTRFMPSWGKAAVAGVFAASGIGLTLLGFIIIGSFFSHSYDGESSNYEIDYSGKVLRVVRKGYDSVKAYDLDGKEVALAKSKPSERNERFRPQTQVYLQAPDEGKYSGTYRQVEKFFIQIYERDRVQTSWFFDETRGIFIGFDRKTQKLSSFLGLHGTVSSQWQPSEAFPLALPNVGYNRQNYRLWQLGNKVYWINPYEQIVTELLTFAPDEKFWAAEQLAYPSSEVNLEKSIIATSRGLYIVSNDGKSRFFFPHPPYVKEKSHLVVTPCLDNSRFFLFYKKSYQAEDEDPTHLIELDKDGKILSENDLPNLAIDFSAQLAQNKRNMIYASPLFPPLFIALAWKDVRKDKSSFVAFPGIAIAALLSATLAFGLRRRMDLSLDAVLLWAAFILCLGIYGLFAFLVIEGFPRRSSCPACGKKRFLHRTNCEHCDSPWPKRKSDGTEVMEPALAEISRP